MKHLALLLVLVLLSSMAMGQVVSIAPVVATKAIPSCVTYPNSRTVSAAAKPFLASMIGKQVYGVGVPAGTIVADTVAGHSDSLITLSKAMTQGGTKTLEIGVSTNTTYAMGDWLGLPFTVWENSGVGGELNLISASLADPLDVVDTVDIVFFDTWADSLGLDSAAVNIPAIEALKIVGVVRLDTKTDLGGGRIVENQDCRLTVPKNALYGRLFARGTIGLVTIWNPWKLRLGFK
jgi:hypothetical protein